MSRINLKIVGDSILRKKAEKVEVFDESLSKLLDDMVETMIFEGGVGLAAPQVGVSKMVAVVNPEPENSETLLRLVNPKITETGAETECIEEGCLSVPGIRGNVIRPVVIVLEYQDEKGNAAKMQIDGIVSRIVQHELDHLAGVLFTDRLSFAKKMMIKGKLKELARRTKQE
ncbi:MAG: peptide deformylase [Candidatus Krumholzibacteriota bacterium]|nr:peptide deformylase [Candidatus Krumholzibacteriota bacterium]